VDENNTTQAVQQYLNELVSVSGESPAEPIVRALLARAAERLQELCSKLLRRHYPRLTRGPMNLHSEEMLGGVVERLIKAMREIRPTNVRQFFALANRHMRWELNDLARRLDRQAVASLASGDIAASAPEPPSTQEDNSSLQRILHAIESLPEEEREAFNLVRIQCMSHAEAAGVIGCATKTVQRRISRGIVLLEEHLRDLLPPAGAEDVL
jgi:RNA polymerase sigma factor (sigma-70 family)